ncbi:casein kinase 1, delta subunit [Trichoderma longibrachiatum]
MSSLPLGGSQAREALVDILVNERYRLVRKISQGGFGMVYSEVDLQSGTEVALKLTHTNDDYDALKGENYTYEVLAGGVGIPHVMWFGEECEYYVLVHELLGPSLEDLFDYCDQKFSLKTVLLIADQAISRIEYIHSKNVLHRDVKPSNFLMGVGRRGNILYAIDFEQSWRDDLESLGYVLVFFALGSLPWQGLKATTDQKKQELVKHMKTSLSAEELCAGLPDAFAKYIDYTRSLRFEDKPNYAHLRQRFRRVFRSKGYKYDNIFDWTVKSFNEIHGLKDDTAVPQTRRPKGGRRKTPNVRGTLKRGRQPKSKLPVSPG